jgi:putative FmdB family regulatory protein
VPIYEYEPLDRDCVICQGRVDVIQSVHEPALEWCPWCGLEVRRVISKASIKVRSEALKHSGERGFTTWRRAKKGQWEKVSGPGVDAIVGTEEQMQEVHAKPAKTWDLDSDDR